MRKRCLLTGSLFGPLLGFAIFSHTVAAQTNFGSVNIGVSATSAVTVTIPSAATLSSIAVLTQGNPNLDFTDAGGGSCATGTAYAANGACTVQVAFTPKFAGTRNGAVVLADASGVIATVYLQGSGVGPQTTFQPGIQSTIDLGGEVNGIANWWPEGIAVDGNGNVYFSNSRQPYQLFKETLSGGIYTRSTVPTSSLGDPFGVAVDGAGNVYVADCDHFRVLKETLFAGSYSESTVASFPVIDGSAPVGVAVDGSGNVYLSLGVEAGIVYKETLTATGYVQSTVVSGLPADAGVAVDGNGNVYVAVDVQNGWIVKETPSAGGYTQTTIPINVPVSEAGIPVGVAVNGSGNVYVAFTESNDTGLVFKEAPTAGGYTQSTIPTSGVIEAFGVAVDGSGNVYVSDYYNGRIVKETLADPPSLSFATTPSGSTSADSPQTVAVSNIGNANLQFSALSYPADFPEASGITSDCTSSTLLAAGGTCTFTIDFSPDEPLNGLTSDLLTESVTLNTNTLDIAATQQTILVSGTETQPVAVAATPTYSPAAGTYTSMQTVTIFDTTPGATIYYTTNGTAPTTSSTVYSNPIIVSSSETIEAIATASGYSNSAVASATYTIPQDFTVAINPASISVLAGQSGTTTITVTDEGGFNGNVSFSCSAGLPAGAACSFTLETVPTPSGISYSTLTVTTSATTASLHRNGRPLFPVAALAAVLCCFGWKKRRRWQMFLLLAVSVAGLGLLTGCGEASSIVSSDPPVTSTVTITATSGSLSHTTTFSLTVN
jgi:sugar lactone lactonase YvrE